MISTKDDKPKSYPPLVFWGTPSRNVILTNTKDILLVSLWINFVTLVGSMWRNPCDEPLHTFVHTDPPGSHNVFLDQLSLPSIDHVRVTTPSVLPFRSTTEWLFGLLPSVLCQRLYPCRTGLSVDTCNSTPFRSACTPSDTVPPAITNDTYKSTRFPTLSSHPDPSWYLDRVFLVTNKRMWSNKQRRYVILQY